MFNNIIEDYSPKLKAKKQKQNCFTKLIKKLQKKLKKYYRNCTDNEKVKKEIMLTLETQICQTKIEKEKKNI